MYHKAYYIFIILLLFYHCLLHLFITFFFEPQAISRLLLLGCRSRGGGWACGTYV